METYAEDKEIEVGDWLAVITPNGVESLKVVGLIAREGAGQTANGSFGVIPLRTAQELFNRDGELDQVDILTEKSQPSARRTGGAQRQSANPPRQGSVGHLPVQRRASA